MEQAVVKILLLGICGYGSNYIKEISERDIPGIKIEGICEVVPNAADLYPIIKEQNIPIYQTPEDFYKEHTADLAVVSTPIHLHYSQIVTCLTHGSNVLTEKPVCTSVEGAHKLEQLEKETGKFISVGYQLNYSRDVLALKHDILDDHFGKPIYMKALHAMRRGDKYYARNSWAGHIDVKGCAVNDSPFNNACAHQFQVMTFLLGERLERAAELADVQAEPYKGNPNVDNFDTITVLAHTMTVQADKKLDFEILEGSENPIGGWISYGYAWRKPIPQLIAKHSGKAPIHFITVLAPEGSKAETAINGDAAMVTLAGGKVLTLTENAVELH